MAAFQNRLQNWDSIRTLIYFSTASWRQIIASRSRIIMIIENLYFFRFRSEHTGIIRQLFELMKLQVL